MKKQITAVLGALFFTCAAYAQPAPITEVTPLQKAALQATKTLPKDYTFSALYQAVEKILEDNAKNTLANFVTKDNTVPSFLQTSEEYAVSRLGEVITARRAYKKIQQRNQQLLQAFAKTGEALNKKGIRFDASNHGHINLVLTQLRQMRKQEQQAAAKRSEAMLKVWLQGVQNITDYGIKY